MARYELRDSDFSFNASLDPFLVLKRMGFTESSIYQEGNLIRIHCPIHKDLVRKSMIIDLSEKTFKCQYSQCDAYEGGLLVELVAMYYDCPLDEVTKNLFGDEDKSSDLLFRGEMYINKGMHAEALPYLEQAAQLDPRNEITRAKLAALLLELNRKDDAFREYMAAAESYAVRGELEKTLSIYNILIILQPGAVKARKELSFLFARMGRPDAAAEQLKWVVDFYLQYGQTKGAQEAVNSMLELQPEDGMSHFLLGQIQKQAGKKAQALQSLEKAARLLIDAEEDHRAWVAVKEGLELAPSNAKLKAMREELETRLGSHVEEDLQEQQNFIDWLDDMDDSSAAHAAKTALAAEGDVVQARAAAQELDQRMSAEVRRPPVMEPLAKESVAAPAEPPAPSQSLSPDDRRVALCLRDMRGMTPDQLEKMRQQLVGMFTDVRKGYEQGLMNEWEMSAVKDFYKAFCIAVDLHRSQQG